MALITYRHRQNNKYKKCFTICKIKQGNMYKSNYTKNGNGSTLYAYKINPFPFSFTKALNTPSKVFFFHYLLMGITVIP